jgi:acyl-CoA synthetase (AMP-forming)/AMP-acid ligase II
VARPAARCAGLENGAPGRAHRDAFGDRRHRSCDRRLAPRRWRDARRAGHARQYGDARLFEERGGDRGALRGGWLHSGDIAVKHPDGYVEVKDRAKDIIISGGENIASLEVEEALYKHPMVVEAAVVAKPDEKWGESPCAFVTLRAEADGQVGADDIIAFCRQHLAGFKIPRTVVFGPLPKTATGKIQKFVLREQAKSF